MDPRDDDDIPYDDLYEAESRLRELQAEMVRQEARIDQLMAAVEERGAAFAILQARMDELERVVEEIRIRYQKNMRRWVWIAGLYGSSIGMAISWLMR